ncbi:MAG: molybdopterin-binding protein [Christensenellaceae bacterium]|jgi:molybdopterin biosynthesis enzyme|nr:molybdopterin-binding protein [Christensenellaceae bacterium]
MKQIKTIDAVGHVLCHDLTRIVKDEYKGAQFHKGHVVREEDIPMLLAMGKEHLYVWELQPGMLHEDDAAERLCAITKNAHMARGEVREGKIELTAETAGLFVVDTARLCAINSIEDIIIATRHGYSPVQAGDKLAGMRVIPLVVEEAKLVKAEAIAGAAGAPLLSLLPYVRKTAGLITTGNEVQKGLIADTFTPVVKQKLAAYGITVVKQALPGDDNAAIRAAIEDMRAAGVDIILCTGGMSVDPDDNTPGAIKESGARIISYGAPVLPGAMFLVGYFENGLPILGLPGCVMYAAATIFDLMLPRVAAGLPITKADIAALGNGGLCLGCTPCRYPVCPFGK